MSETIDVPDTWRSAYEKERDGIHRCEIWNATAAAQLCVNKVAELEESFGRLRDSVRDLKRENAELKKTIESARKAFAELKGASVG